jgi:hypothetical protein
MSHDPEAIRRLTRGYRNLRGLAYLPFALYFLVTHSANLVDVRFWPIAGLVLGVAAAAAAFAAHSYYDRRFGVVTRLARWGGGTLVLALIALVALQVTSAYLALPVQLGFLAVGIAIAVHALRHFELYGQRLFFAMIFIVFSFLAQSSFDLRAPDEFWHEAAAVGFDAIWIMVAIWDHRTLVKAFDRARLADTGGALPSCR